MIKIDALDPGAPRLDAIATSVVVLTDTVDSPLPATRSWRIKTWPSDVVTPPALDNADESVNGFTCDVSAVGSGYVIEMVRTELTGAINSYTAFVGLPDTYGTILPPGGLENSAIGAADTAARDHGFAGTAADGTDVLLNAWLRETRTLAEAGGAPTLAGDVTGTLDATVVESLEHLTGDVEFLQDADATITAHAGRYIDIASPVKVASLAEHTVGGGVTIAGLKIRSSGTGTEITPEASELWLRTDGAAGTAAEGESVFEFAASVTTATITPVYTVTVPDGFWGWIDSLLMEYIPSAGHGRMHRGYVKVVNDGGTLVAGPVGTLSSDETSGDSVLDANDYGDSTTTGGDYVVNYTSTTADPITVKGRIRVTLVAL